MNYGLDSLSPPVSAPRSGVSFVAYIDGLLAAQVDRLFQ